jgi:predicted alpha/beta-fold hydrolase
LVINDLGPKTLTTSSPQVPAAATVACGAALMTRRLTTKAHRLEMVVPETPFAKSVLSECPTLNQEYTSPWWMWNGHVETIFAAWFRRDTPVIYKRECLITEDKGCVAIDWPVHVDGRELPPQAPVVLLLPGLTGGSHDTYVKHFVSECWAQGYRAVVFNSRGTSDSPVTSPQFYSASFTGDTRAVVEHVRARYPTCDLLACGWSLGANILVRYLGEEKERTPIKAAASLCNPFDLVKSDNNFHHGFNRIYDFNLAKNLRNIFKKHEPLFVDIGGAFNPELAASCKTIREFDDALTRVSFGWPSVDAYYEGSGSHHSIPHVSVPLLCISAADDPIAPYHAIPFDAIRGNQNCVLAVTPTGGHLGWVSGPKAPLGGPWTGQPVLEFFNATLKHYSTWENAVPTAAGQNGNGREKTDRTAATARADAL